MAKKTYNGMHIQLALEDTAEQVEENGLKHLDYVYLIKNFI